MAAECLHENIIVVTKWHDGERSDQLRRGLAGLAGEIWAGIEANLKRLKAK